MKKESIYRLAHALADQIKAVGVDRHLTPVLRDAWMSIARWRELGEARMAADEASPALPGDLMLTTAPMASAAAMVTTGDTWIILARHDAGQPVATPLVTALAFSRPMLTYVCPVPTGGIAAGSINLTDSPTPRDYYLPAGKSGDRWLHQDEISHEERLMDIAMRVLYAEAK